MTRGKSAALPSVTGTTETKGLDPSQEASAKAGGPKGDMQSKG